MDRFSVIKVPPNVAKDVRAISGGGKKLDHPYYKVEERKGTGKATCRQCGEMIAEGDPTIYFHYAPDDDNTWVRNKGTIHADDCEGGKDEWTKCPSCRKQIPRDDWSAHWKAHRKERQSALIQKRAYWAHNPEDHGILLDWMVKGFHAVGGIEKEGASGIREDKERRDRLTAEIPEQDLPSVHGEPALQLPDGYKVVPIKTRGDAMFEGTMMSHCLANPQVHQMFCSHYGMDEDDWSGSFGFPPPPPREAVLERFPDATEDMLSHIHDRGESRLMSLRDHNGIPRATWWEPKDSTPGTELREVCGFANSTVKPKYEHRIRQYLRHSLEQNGMSEGKFEHIGDFKDAEDEAGGQYMPIQTLKADELPDKDEEYTGQQYERPELQKTADASVSPIDPIDVPLGESKPKSLRQKWMDKLEDVSEAVTWGLYDPDKEWKKNTQIDIDVPPKKSSVDDLDKFEKDFAEDPNIQDAEKALDLSGPPPIQHMPHPKNPAELRQHMIDHHEMYEDDAEANLPDAALGLVHTSDHSEGNLFGHEHPNPLEDLEKDWSEDPQIKQDLSEMKGKELADQIWDAIGGNDGPHLCPECGTHETEEKGTVLDEDGWPYTKMKCNGCGHEFDKDASGSGLNFTQDEPQSWHDEWRKRDRTAHFMGACHGCGTRTYAFDDGENDPRGPLGDHAASPIQAEDYEKTGPDVPLCFNCANEYEPYKAAVEFGHKIWNDPKTTTAGWKMVSSEEEEEEPGYKPRVDPYAGQALEKSQRAQLDQEARKLQRNMKSVDQFAGSWRGASEVEVRRGE